jgi:hypothetical protein
MASFGAGNFAGNVMNLNRLLVLLFLLPLLGFSWLIIVAVEPSGPSPLEHVAIGYILGTMFGQATLASAWTALGPAPLAWRLPLSLGWIAALLFALLLNVTVHFRRGGVELVLIMGACLAAQWVLIQIPLWGLAVGYGMRLRHRDEIDIISARDRQFGIRQLMILTAIVAVVLGACRWIAMMTTALWAASNWANAPIFVFLAAAGIVMCLPLLVAALLPRHAGLASTAVVVLIGLGTWFELPLVNQVGGGPDLWHLIFINLFQSATVLAVVALIRCCGYSTTAFAGESRFAS